MTFLQILTLVFCLTLFMIAESFFINRLFFADDNEIDSERQIDDKWQKIMRELTVNNFVENDYIINLSKRKFVDYKNKFNKTYSKDEDHRRFKRFILKLIHVNHHNKKFAAGLETFSMGINHMSDWSEAERSRLNAFRKPEYHDNVKYSEYISPALDYELPKEVDWRKIGAVTPVKSQGSCGSCYSFSATGALEAQIWRKTGRLVSLSEQQIVDCDQYDYHCQGGLMLNTFKYIREAGGLETEANYPYVSGVTKMKNPRCTFRRREAVSTDTGAVLIDSSRGGKTVEEKMREAIALVGPLSVAIYAPDAFHDYKGGVFHAKYCAGHQMNHAVLVVGYGTDAETNQDYWIVKNSWGPQWGEAGYFRLPRNVNACGITEYPVYPLV